MKKLISGDSVLSGQSCSRPVAGAAGWCELDVDGVDVRFAVFVAGLRPGQLQMWIVLVSLDLSFASR